MLSNKLRLAALLLLLPLVIAACGDDDDADIEPTEPAAETPAETPEASPTSAVTPDVTAEATPGAGTPLGRQTGGATCDALFPAGEPDVGQMVDDVFVCIAEPDPGATVQGTVEVRGFQAGAFEQNVVIELRGPDGDVLAQTSATANAPDIGMIVGEWTTTLEVPADAPAGEGTIAAFASSPRDGSIDFGGEIPVTIAQ